MQIFELLKNKLQSSIELYELLKSIERENSLIYINNLSHATSKAYCEILEIKNIIVKTIITEWYKTEEGNKLFNKMKNTYISKEVSVRIKNNIADNIRNTSNANPHIIYLLSNEQKKYTEQIETVKKEVIKSIQNFNCYSYWPDKFTELEDINFYEIIVKL